MKTQQHLGRGSLVKRLTAQTGSGALAENLLKKRGQMGRDGKLTAAGKVRDRMTAAERSNDRAAHVRGGKAGDFRFNPRTNASSRRK